ncbi:MAG: YCF48-related protein [Anaerolineales bacterium]
MSQRYQSKRPVRGRWPNAGLWVVGLGVLGLAAAGWLWFSNNAPSGSAVRPVSQLTTADFHSLAFSPTEPETVFFGHHHGLLVSRDGGRTWEPTSLQNADAMALAVPLSNPNVMYAAGHEVFFKSTDGGASWQAINTNLPGLDIHGFAVDPQNADTVYANVVGFGMFTSHDGGMTWAALPPSPPSTFNLVVGETPQTLYAAAGDSGLLRSTDGGQQWSRLSSLPGVTIAVTYDAARRRVYAGNDAGLFASDNGGATWAVLGPQGAILAIAVSPLDATRILAVDASGNVFASRDGGVTWAGE